MIKENICGIYKITSPTGRIYIGQSVNCYNRIKWYRSGARGQRVLNNSIIKYGWGAHTFQVIKECREDELNEYEKHYALLYNSYSKDNGMNIRECGGSTGRLHEDTKRRISESNKIAYSSPERKAAVSLRKKGAKASEETKIKISNALLGKQIGKLVSDETRKKLSKAMTGKKMSEETKALMRISRIGIKVSNATKEKIRIASTGRLHTEESKQKMSERQIGAKHHLYGKHINNEIKQKMSNSHKGKVFSEKHKINLSESKKGCKNAMFGSKNTTEMRRINSEKNSRGNNAFAKLVLNTETGIYYECAKDAWDSFQRQSFEYFKFKLQGKNHINNTSFIYA